MVIVIVVIVTVVIVIVVTVTIIILTVVIVTVVIVTELIVVFDNVLINIFFYADGIAYHIMENDTTDLLWGELLVEDPGDILCQFSPREEMSSSGQEPVSMHVTERGKVS